MTFTMFPQINYGLEIVSKDCRDRSFCVGVKCC